MSARINNMPSYVVYDRSYQQQVSYSATHSITLTGTPTEIIDKNLTTYYQVYSTYTGAPLGNQSEIILDYGQDLWNTQVYYSWTEPVGGQVGTGGLKYSSDGINWITHTTTLGVGVMNLFHFRYLKFENQCDSNANIATKIYECRVMGA